MRFISYFLKEYILPFMIGVTIVFAMLMLFALFLGGCGGQLPVAPAPPGTTREVVEPELYDEEEDGFGSYGDVPFGYYERQCQWDACGGPLPDRQDVAINPQPEMR